MEGIAAYIPLVNIQLNYGKSELLMAKSTIVDGWPEPKHAACGPTTLHVHGLGYPLVNIQKTMEKHHFLWLNQLSMAMFNSYVKLPMGIGDDEYIILYTPDIPKYMRNR